MKRRSFFSFLIVGVVVLMLTGIGGYFWLGRESPLSLLRGGRQTTPAAAMFVPKQAPVMASMLVNPNRLESFGQVVARGGERRKLRAQLNDLKTSLLANTGLDYKRDIQPWIGDEITLAVTTTDIDRDASNGRQTGYLMAIATKNADKSRECLDLLFSKRVIGGTDLVFEQYKGIKLISDNSRPQLDKQNAIEPSHSKSDKVLSGAVVGDRFVLFANHPKVLREAINNVQAPDLSLTTSSQYQQALTLLPQRSIGLTFLNLPSVVAWQGLEPAAQTYESQIIALELNRKGLLAETALLAAPDQEISPPAPALSQTVGALKYIPAATSLSISGSDLSRLENTDLSQLWQQVSTELLGSGDGASDHLVNQPLAKLQARWGIDLPKDIFSWVQGEYALGLLPRAAQTTPDLIFVAEKSDAAEQGISHLDVIAQQQGLSITPLPLENQKVSAWTQLTTAPTSSSDSDRALITLKAKVQGVHATAGNYEIFTTSVEAMDEALKAPNKNSLVDNRQFQASIDAIPKPNAGYVYLDWTASKTIVERQLPILKLIEVAGKPFFSNLRSLTVSSYGSEKGVLKGGIFFRLNT
jgi:hypothetical protein